MGIRKVIIYLTVFVAIVCCSNDNQNLQNSNKSISIVNNSESKKENAIKMWLNDTDIEHLIYGEDDSKLTEELKSEDYQELMAEKVKQMREGKLWFCDEQSIPNGRTHSDSLLSSD